MLKIVLILLDLCYFPAILDKYTIIRGEYIMKKNKKKGDQPEQAGQDQPEAKKGFESTYQADKLREALTNGLSAKESFGNKIDVMHY